MEGLTSKAPAQASKATPSAVRSVTDTEVAFFDQNGWVFLPGLVSPELCKDVLDHGRGRLEGFIGRDPSEAINPQEKDNKSLLNVASKDQGTVTNIKQWAEWRGATRAANDPYFSKIAADRTMGYNVRRLFRRDTPVRIYHDIFVCKLPDESSTRTSWHQDSTNFPLDRNALTIWVALDEITPDMGSLQFYSGSHRCGMLGGIPANRMDLTDEYPDLARFPVSQPPHMKPGDATVHHGLTVHGAGANTTSKPRWSYLTAYFPADARYSGAPNHDTDGFDLKRGHTLDHPSFTLLPD